METDSKLFHTSSELVVASSSEIVLLIVFKIFLASSIWFHLLATMLIVNKSCVLYFIKL